MFYLQYSIEYNFRWFFFSFTPVESAFVSSPIHLFAISWLSFSIFSLQKHILFFSYKFLSFLHKPDWLWINVLYNFRYIRCITVLFSFNHLFVTSEFMMEEKKKHLCYCCSLALSYSFCPTHSEHCALLFDLLLIWISRRAFVVVVYLFDCVCSRFNSTVSYTQYTRCAVHRQQIYEEATPNGECQL